MMKDVLEYAYRLIEPTPEQRMHADTIASRCLDTVKSIARKYEEVTDVILVGSYAKDTWLPESIDIDIFLKIKPSVDEHRFESIGVEIGLNALKEYNPYLRYAQHPYVESMVEGIRVNVVPCYDVEIGRWRSATDRSPYHTSYMLNMLDAMKRSEVRLLKRFMKVIGVYGAEIAVEGFSGYVCEVLILAYGSFIDVLKNASVWRDNEVITVPSSRFSVNGIRNRFRDDPTPLMIPDPIDEHRNLGAAISYESVGRFILAARNFLKSPSIEYFTTAPANVTATHDKDDKDDKDTNSKHKPEINSTIVLEFAYERRSDDILYGQLKSSMHAIVKQLKGSDFNVIRSICYVDCNKSKAYIALLLDSLTIPPITVKEGPKVFDSSNATRFIEKNRDTLMWIDNEGRLKALARRRFVEARSLIEYILTDRLESSGISKGIASDIKKNGFKVHVSDVRMINGLLSSDRYAFMDC